MSSFTPIKIRSGMEFPSLPPQVQPGGPSPLGILQPGAPETESFDTLLSRFVSSVETMQGESKVASEAFLRGDATDLHAVMIAAEEAGVSFDLLLEIRNKIVEGYQELVRMPI